MIANLYAKLCQISPRFKKFSKQVMYQFLARYYQKQDWTFMNYGYAHLDDDEKAPDLQREDEVNRFCIQLYHHVASAVDLAERKVLEIGSGRGGGAQYIKTYLEPQLVVGVDYSKNAVNLCNKSCATEGLAFVPGDAENLPFNDNVFDAVINVESSHCYHSMDRFLSEVRRVLKPGGHFLFADFRDSEHLSLLDIQLQRTGMTQIKQTNITPNVVAALDIDHERKLAQIQRGAPKLLTGLLQQFAGSKGTRIYRRFKRQHTVYKSFVLQKANS